MGLRVILAELARVLRGEGGAGGLFEAAQPAAEGVGADAGEGSGVVELEAVAAGLEDEAFAAVGAFGGGASVAVCGAAVVGDPTLRGVAVWGGGVLAGASGCGGVAALLRHAVKAYDLG
jgi:hypothetical protein